MTPKLTAAGKALLLNSLSGEPITFTKMQIGNGAPQAPETAAGLNNPLLTVDFSDVSVGDDYATLTARFTNGTVTSGFHITETGFFAEDSNGNEILYAIGGEDESTADYVPAGADRILEMQLDALLFIGDAENVSAAISSSLVYTSKEEFDGHTQNRSNPHGVTAEQIGLGNVPNVSTDDQTPTFTEALTFSNIESGETVKTLFGKIKLAIKNLIAHIGNRSNPHACTAAQVGAAAKSHTHSTTDINDGVLGVARGGTGVSSLSALATTLHEECGLAKLAIGSYQGTGEMGFGKPNSLSFESPPKWLRVFGGDGALYSSSGGFLVKYGTKSIGESTESATVNLGSLYFTWEGATVKWYSPKIQGHENPAYQLNAQGVTYNYIAIL